jgi:hypothetical protein
VTGPGARAARIDHVLLAVVDLERAAADLRATSGLDAHEGGRHPAWGTANWILPLGDAYLELVAVVDTPQADASTFGRWVAAEARPEPAPFAWCVSPVSLDATAERLGLDIVAGSRRRPSGKVLSWRIAGLDHAERHPWLPFFIDWPDRTTHPGRRDGSSDTSSVRLQIEGDVDELGTWLDGEALPVDLGPGRAGVTAVTFDGVRGPVTVRSRGSG